jgi:hypothetical protein
MASRLVTTLIRSAVLFLISVLLVLGFWFHSEFYQLGLTSLALVGGFVTFLVIGAARLAISGELPKGRPVGDLTFSLEEGDRILRGVAATVVRPAEAARLPGVGQVVRAKYDTGPEFARLLVMDARRSYLSDLTEQDARDAGFRTASDLRGSAAGRGSWESGDVVTILRVRRLGAAR